MNTLSQRITEALSNTAALSKKFATLNKQYVKLDKALDAAEGKEYDDISDKLEDIQQEMSKISAQLEN